jgi:hypothetical protein
MFGSRPVAWGSHRPWGCPQHDGHVSVHDYITMGLEERLLSAVDERGRSAHRRWHVIDEERPGIASYRGSCS